MSGTAPDPYLEDLKERLFRYFDTPGAKSGAKMNGLRQTLAATRYNMTALESDKGHGRMTGLILLVLEGKADQAREDGGRITIYTLHSYLQNEMPVDRQPSFSGGSAGRSGLLAYYPELRHKQTVGQQLTTGLTVLSMDYAARIQNFFTEYLGTPERPVPFGGRQEDMSILDSWLDNPKKPPYLLLAAPAGRGKSALLVRWIQPLLNRSDLAVVFLPISIRFRTNLAGVTFAALTARLAFLHGEKVTATPDTPLEVWRGLMTDYLTRPLPDGRRLLLVLDGLDEAADWEVGPDLFPLDPPEGLQIIASARYLAGDANAKPWLRRLGWHRPKLAYPLDLNPLTPKGVADVLQHMGFPLDRLGARVDIVNELYRLSMGDPLLVRLYVDDLWERGETAARLQPEELREIRPGLEGYFERWWDDQRHLWGNQVPLREPAVQMLLSLLACALGPLSQEDTLRLASPNVGLSSWTLEENLYPLKRFVVGDGRRQGYVFCHPRLSAYFYEERLTAQDRRIVESRFLDWGKETLTALNEGSLSPEQVSPYIVQYYGAHLERANSSPQDFLALVSQGWKLAWEKLEGTYAGFLNDTGKVWRVLERYDAAALKAGHLVPYIGDEVRCALCQASANSLAKNIPPAFLLRVVEKGTWNPAQGLAYARYMPDLEERSQVLVKLVPFLPDFLKEGGGAGGN